MRLVGISGLANAGKDTAADALVNRLKFTRIACADAMKRAVLDWFPLWDEERLWGPSARRNEPDPRYGGVSARRVLQLLGSEFGRDAYPNLWIDIVIRDANKILSDDMLRYSRTSGVDFRLLPKFTPGVVVSDVRFRNELEAIKAAGGHAIRIVRPGAGLEGEAANHRSEVEQLGIRDEEFDSVIINSGTIEDLHDRVCEAVKAVLEAA